MVSQMTRGRETASQKSVGASGAWAQRPPATDAEDDDEEPLLRRVETAGGGREVDLRPRPGRDEDRLAAARVGDEGVAGEVAEAVAGDSGAALPARDEEARVLTIVWVWFILWKGGASCGEVVVSQLSWL